MPDLTEMHIATIRRDGIPASEAGPLNFDAWASLTTEGGRYVMYGNPSDGFKTSLRENDSALDDLQRLSDRSPGSVTVCARAAQCKGKMPRAMVQAILGTLVDLLEMGVDLPPQAQFNEMADCFSDPQWLRDIFENAMAHSPNPNWEGFEAVRARIHEAAAQGVARRRDQQRAQFTATEVAAAESAEAESSLLSW